MEIKAAKICVQNGCICESAGVKKRPDPLKQKYRSGCHKEVGPPEFRINAPLEGFVLTAQIFSTSHLVLGPVLCRSGTHRITTQSSFLNNF